MKDTVENKTEIKRITITISEMEAEENRNNILKHLKSYSDNPEANLESSKKSCGQSVEHFSHSQKLFLVRLILKKNWQ